MSGPAAARARPGRASLALDNLRAYVILLVLAFHSCLAYLSFLPPDPFPFDGPPYSWRAFPIVDSHRWLGLDLFCAWQDLFLMSLFFFLSGLFVWPSLKRRGVPQFLGGRLLRLGVPFAVVVALLMPVANYPTYLQTAVDPGVAAYWHHFRDLPFWPSGPMWFLWLLLAADLVATGVHRIAPHWGDWLGRLSGAAARPFAYFAGLLTLAALAYVPLALVFGPEPWLQFGPFAFQKSRPLLYAVYFFAGAGIGAHGIERGLFGPDGALAKRSPVWLASALGSFMLWLGLTAIVVSYKGRAPLGVRALDDLSYVLACFASCFCVLALVLRLAAKQGAWLSSLSRNAYGMYLVHYLFVVWLQYAFLPVGLPAVVKAAAVFVCTVLLSWTTTAALRRLPLGALIVGGGRRMSASPS
ncbi:MAG TPA: acyltransferase [Stellaceae bacterium]|jgi:peptidoglycan/LPS O-acetylase OafA/YrhL